MGNQHGRERRNYGRKIDWEHAERPSPPGKPYLAPENPDQQPDVITLRWSPPASDGGAPIIGYLVEHRRTGSPHWLRASPQLAADTELTLTGLEPGWRYQFRVSAESDVGRSEPGELSEPLTVTLQRSAASAPHFNRELQDTIALENEKVEFTVHVIATPPPKISWYKDGFEIFSSRRTKIVTESEQSTLIIHQAALEDEGEIKCTATNRAGHVVTKANLKLEAPPRIRLPRQYEDGLLFEKGEVIRLKVSTAGRPLPRVSWLHNGEILQTGGRYEITDTERTSVVRISEARREDRGEYLIRGMNKIGEDIVSFLVTVTDRPLPPGKAQVVMTLGRTVTLSWTCPEDDGGCKIGNYIVEYFRIGWNMWLKAATCRQLTTVLSELIEGSEYKFRVKAENPYGVSEPSEESDIIFIPDPKRGILQPPPRNEVDLTDTWLEEAKKRSSEDENEKDENPESKRRKILDENARKLLDTPLSVLLPRENTVTLKVIEKPLRKGDLSPTPSPDLSREGGSSLQNQATKRHFESVADENAPPPVPKRKNKGEKRSVTASPDELMPVDERPEDSNNNSKSLQARNDINISSHEKSRFLSASSAFPRENDDSVLHGSSELMLVLLPEERAKSVELSSQHRSEIEMSLAESGVAPPMSLSAPELGSGEPLEMPLMRDAVSSTELLHERAMARFYQAVADEESQTMLKRRYSMDRKSVERRASLKDGGELKRRHSFQEALRVDKSGVSQDTGHLQSTEPEDLASRVPIAEQTGSKIPVKKEIRKEEESISSIVQEPISEDTQKSGIPRLKKESSIPETKSKPLLIRREERLSSIEREQLEFALVRDRIRQKNEQNLKPNVLPPRPPTLQQQSSMSSQLSSFDGEPMDDDEDLEDEEYLEDEEEEDDYLEDEEEIEEEGKGEGEDVELQEEEVKLNDAKYRPKTLVTASPPPVPKHGIPPAGSSPERRSPRPRERVAPYAQEEETYHPRSMIPTRSVFPKFETPLPVTLESPEEAKVEHPVASAKLEESGVTIKVEPSKEEKDENKLVAPKKPARLKEEAPPIKDAPKIVEAPKEVNVLPSTENKEAISKIPVPQKPEKKKTAIMKKIEKLALKREKKTPAIASLIVDSAAPITSVVLPKPILKKKSIIKKKDKEAAKGGEKSQVIQDSGTAASLGSENGDESPGRKKKQVRIAEPSEATTLLKLPATNDAKLSPTTARNQKLQRRQQSLEEDEEGNKILIYHYSDIVREFGGSKKPQPKLYLDYEELKAHATPEEEKTADFDELPLPLPPKQQEDEKPTAPSPAASDVEERGSVLDMSEVDNISLSESVTEPIEPTMATLKPPSPEPEQSASARSSPARTNNPSPTDFRPLSPEERVRSSMEYLTDVAMFLVACWLYLFKNELYAIPVLCLMVYRQVKDTMQEKYRNVKESISNKIPDRFKKKTEEGEDENVEKDEEDKDENE